MDDEVILEEEEKQEENEQAEENTDYLTKVFSKKSSRIFFIVLMVMFVISVVFGDTWKNYPNNKTESVPQETTVTESVVTESIVTETVTAETAVTESVLVQEDDNPIMKAINENSNKTAKDYLKEMKFGKSNAVALIILFGLLIFVQYKRKQGESQKESK